MLDARRRCAPMLGTQPRLFHKVEHRPALAALAGHIFHRGADGQGGCELLNQRSVAQPVPPHGRGVIGGQAKLGAVVVERQVVALVGVNVAVVIGSVVGVPRQIVDCRNRARDGRVKMEIPLGAQVIRMALPVSAHHAPRLCHLNHVPEFVRHRISPALIGKASRAHVHVPAIRVASRPEPAIPGQEVHLVAWRGGRVEFTKRLVVPEFPTEDLVAFLAHPQRPPCMRGCERCVRRVPPHADVLALHPARVRCAQAGAEVCVQIQCRRRACNIAHLDVVDLKSPRGSDQWRDAQVSQTITPEDLQSEIDAVGVKRPVLNDAGRRQDELPRGRKARVRRRAILELHIPCVARRQLEADLEVIIEAEVQIRSAADRRAAHGSVGGRRVVVARQQAARRCQSRDVRVRPAIDIPIRGPFPKNCGTRQPIH